VLEGEEEGGEGILWRGTPSPPCFTPHREGKRCESGLSRAPDQVLDGAEADVRRGPSGHVHGVSCRGSAERRSDGHRGPRRRPTAGHEGLLRRIEASQRIREGMIETNDASLSPNESSSSRNEASFEDNVGHVPSLQSNVSFLKPRSVRVSLNDSRLKAGSVRSRHRSRRTKARSTRARQGSTNEAMIDAS
jgi:hypothetical protein